MGSILTKIIIFFIVKNFTPLTYFDSFLIKEATQNFQIRLKQKTNITQKKKQNRFLALFDFVICLLELLMFLSDLTSQVTSD